MNGIDADEMAAWLDTISYEVLCSPSSTRAARLHQRMNKGELRARMRQARRALSEAAQQGSGTGRGHARIHVA